MITSLKENSSYMQHYPHEATESNQSSKSHNSFSWASPFGIRKADILAMPPPMRLTSSIIPPKDDDDPYNRLVGKFSKLTASNINPSERHTSSYSCNLLRELEGTWTTDTPEEDEILLTVTCHGNQWHAIGAVKSGTGVVPDQIIYQDKNIFTLRSTDGNVMAIMFTAMITKNSLTWFSVFGTKILWRRKAELQDESSPRNSTATESSGISQMCSTSSGSSASGDIRPELCKPICNAEVPYCSSASNSSNLEARRSISVASPYSQLNEKLGENDLLELFQNHCTKSPSLLQKVLNWGISQIPNQSTDRLEIERLACGRLWVSALFTVPNKKRRTEAWRIIEELKGAYELVAPGVYLQPPALPGEPGAQHRLRKNNYGLWFIEKHYKEKDEWCPCAQELPMGKWIDLKSRNMYVVKVVSMLSILTRMTKQLSDFGSMEKGMEFLFTSCNQKKLNTNLKARNIKHNISNLHVKLDKQRSLCFAIRVASIADSIALENTAVCPKEKPER